MLTQIAQIQGFIDSANIVAGAIGADACAHAQQAIVPALNAAAGACRGLGSAIQDGISEIMGALLDKGLPPECVAALEGLLNQLQDLQNTADAYATGFQSAANEAAAADCDTPAGQAEVGSAARLAGNAPAALAGLALSLADLANQVSQTIDACCKTGVPPPRPQTWLNGGCPQGTRPSWVNVALPGQSPRLARRCAQAYQ